MIIIKSSQSPKDLFQRHALSNNMVQEYTVNTKGKKVMSMPVCPKCERAGLRDKGWLLQKIMCCPHCGYKGPATHQVSAYLREGLYR